MAKEHPTRAFETLAHHIDMDWLHEAYQKTRKDGATGVDGQDGEEYSRNLEGNLQSLLERFKAGTYRAPPVRRVYVPKADGTQMRPIGIPTFEDKVLQRAVSMVLEAIYEQDFFDGSYGFRPGRSAHQALDAVRDAIMPIGGGRILEVDIRKCFDTLDHEHLRAILRRRVRDGVLLRVIGKWLKAGVMEEGKLSHPDVGSPQGGVVSPLLMNVYLDEVIDTWFERDVRPRLRGWARLVRYADDMVMVFRLREDARRVLNVLPERFGKYGLTLHPDKTRLVRFTRPDRFLRGGPPGTFDFLGLTHHWGRSRLGKWVVMQRTAKDRFNRSLHRIREYCRHHRHEPLAVQQKNLRDKLRGHYQYFGVRGNYRALSRLYRETRRAWQKWLSRRSNTGYVGWDRMLKLLERFPLPRPRLRARTPRSKPMS